MDNNSRNEVAEDIDVTEHAQDTHYLHDMSVIFKCRTTIIMNSKDKFLQYFNMPDLFQRPKIQLVFSAQT